ncbi:MAG: hypothetical protein JXB35_05640 [Anaerolineae bacterium]|nr:hypothetical protein [Anaerolineae bacterium]
MSGKTLRFVIAGVLCLHSIGHLMGIIPALGIINTTAASPQWLRGWTSHSWLLSNLLGGTFTRVLSILLFLGAMATTLAASLALLDWGIPHDSWRTLAVIAACISLPTVILYWNALIFFIPHKVGALGMDLAILAGLLVMNWPAEAITGW